MRKKHITTVALTVVMTLALILNVAPYRANATQQTAETMTMDGNVPYAPINTIVQQMGGQVERHEADKYTLVTISGKTARIDDTWGFAEIDGKFTPYETTVSNNWTVPTFKKPILKDGNSYVPVTFLTEKLGLKLEVSGDTVTFNTVDGGTATPSSSDSGNSGATNVVEPNKPASSPTTPSGGSSDTGGTTTPTPGPAKTTTYTGSQVKEQLYGLGFVNYNSGLKLNPYGANGNIEYNYMVFGVLSGNKDMSLLIQNSTPEVDQKIRMVCSYMLPSEGGRLYSILDNPGLSSQTLQMEGRNVAITVANYGIVIVLGPIIK